MPDYHTILLFISQARKRFNFEITGEEAKKELEEMWQPN
jgi:hypothetical protein